MPAFSTIATRAPRRTGTKPKPASSGADTAVVPVERPLSKLDQVEALLLAPAGATIVDLTTATGWQQHSVRGALAGALKKRGLLITSDKAGGVRRYRASRQA
jgi:hypothetical protein